MQGRSKYSAVWLALLVTFLWSTSWVLIKRGLQEVPPLTFAGLRYSLAFLLLLPGLLHKREHVRALDRRSWIELIVLGVVFYTLTQGGQFLTLQRLDAIPFSLMLSFTPLLVSLIGMLTLSEKLRTFQWIGIALSLLGAAIFFGRVHALSGSGIGFLLAGLTLGANAISSLLGRAVNRRHRISPLVVTPISMGVGGVLLLAIGLGTQGLPRLSAVSWGIILWLAVVNTALAFTVWNHTLRTLSASQSSVINNTMVIQIAILAWIFLGESLTVLQIVGLGVVAAGTLLVQYRRAARTPRTSAGSSDCPGV
jgi:drug/metabolite transporter (DMT)-like permease